MKLLRYISILGTFLGTIIISSSGTVLLFFQTDSPIPPTIEKETESVVSAETNTTEETLEEEIPYTLKESGWIPNWGYDLGLESLENNEGIIDTVLPVLYTIDSGGNVISRGVSDSKIRSLMSYAEENSIRVIPTVGSYDTASVSNLLQSEEKVQKAVTYILGQIDEYGFDGIDLDIEMINSSDSEEYVSFLETLSEELGEDVLSVTVFPQWSNATYTDHEETRVAQNYEAISDIADEVRIMTYDYTPISSSTPGPIAPLNWIEQVIQYALRYIPEEKLLLGVHLYAYEWINGKTVALTYTSLEAILNNTNINTTYREDIGEGYAEFGCEGGQRCTLYYQNNNGVQARRDLAEKYQLAGVSYWRLGGEMGLLK